MAVLVKYYDLRQISKFCHLCKFGFAEFFGFAQSDSVFVGDGFPIPKTALICDTII